MFLHGEEIAVVMQQPVVMFDTECADDNVSGLSDRDTELSQFAIVPGGTRGQFGIQEWHEGILTQSALEARRMGLISGALKNFE